MDLHRLDLLLELSRLGSMRAVGEARRLSTSTVSQQLAVLAREAGTALIEPDGRRVRLTPAGRRLAEHAVTILAAVDRARHDLEPGAEPEGTIRVGGFATAIRASLLPVMAELGSSHPRVEIVINEFEPLEAFALLEQDALDLALTYDYNLAPASHPSVVEVRPIWTAPWGLGVPSHGVSGAAELAGWVDRPWIVNSRNTADEVAVRTLGTLTGFTPAITHSIDSLDLVEELIVAGLGVGLLPLRRRSVPGVRVLGLVEPPVTMRAYAAIRRGRESWSPLALLLDRLTAATPGELTHWPSLP